MSDGSTVTVADSVDEVAAPLRRVFREYGLPGIHWFAVAVAVNFVARLSSLVPSLMLGTAIDAVFNESSGYSLPLVPQGWLPTQSKAQFWFSVSLIVGAFAVTPQSRLTGRCHRDRWRRSN